MNQRILIIEDEEAIAVPLADRLRREGYAVECTGDGSTGYALALNRQFHLILLDLMLPGKSGEDICRDLRQEGIMTPILMLTAKGHVFDKVVGLKLGADDYLTKPFDSLELLARIEAILRRAQAPAYNLGGIRIDIRRAEVWRGGRRVALSPKEYQLLRYLVEHPLTVLSREELLREVWGYDAALSTRTVDVHIGWLRQKLEQDPRHPRLIETVIGSGYRLGTANPDTAQ